MTNHLCGLPKTAALIGLGRCLYETWSLLFGLSVPTWEALSPSERHYFVARADDMLDRLDPDPAPLPLFDLITTARVIRFPEAPDARR